MRRSSSALEVPDDLFKALETETAAATELSMAEEGRLQGNNGPPPDEDRGSGSNVAAPAAAGAGAGNSSGSNNTIGTHSRRPLSRGRHRSNPVTSRKRQGSTRGSLSPLPMRPAPNDRRGTGTEGADVKGVEVRNDVKSMDIAEGGGVVGAADTEGIKMGEGAQAMVPISSSSKVDFAPLDGSTASTPRPGIITASVSAPAISSVRSESPASRASPDRQATPRQYNSLNSHAFYDKSPARPSTASRSTKLTTKLNSPSATGTQRRRQQQYQDQQEHQQRKGNGTPAAMPPTPEEPGAIQTPAAVETPAPVRGRGRWLRRTGRLFRGGGRRRRGSGTVQALPSSPHGQSFGRGHGNAADGVAVGFSDGMGGQNRDSVGGTFLHGASPFGADTSARRLDGRGGGSAYEGHGYSSIGMGGHNSDGDETTEIVRSVEKILRHLLLILGAYLLGAAKPDLVPLVSRFAELGCAAWFTCALILLLAAYRTHEDGDAVNMGRQWTSSWYGEGLEKEEALPAAAISADPNIESSRAIANASDDIPVESTPLLSRNFDDDQDESLGSSSLVGDESMSPERRPPPPTRRSQHPELEDLILINCSTLERIIPNSEPVVLDNELFSGKLLMMIRTSDADADGSPSRMDQSQYSTSQKAVSSYFRDKKRRFEFQFQVSLKKKPASTLYLGCEIEEPIKMGMVQRAFAGACLNFVKKMNKGLHVCLTGQDGGYSADDIAAGMYEKTHLAFTVEASMDALVATKPGSPLPTLGEPIIEDAESLRHRKRGGSVDWNTEDTYTMGLWSAYVDFTEFKCMNFPGIRDFSLASVGWAQPLNLTLYSLKNTSPGEEARYHYECDKVVVTHLEISHREAMDPGPYALKVMSNTKATGSSHLSPQHARDETADILMDESFSADEDDLDNDFDEEDAATLDDLAGGMYLRSGEPIVLREAATASPLNGINQDFFVANGGGFAIMSQASSTIVIEKAKRNLESGSRSKLIKSGDTVMVKLITKQNELGEGGSVRYLSLHRGWWLKWVANMPKSNGYFKISAHSQNDDATLLDTVSLYSSSRSLGLQMTYIQLGQSFSLHHKRWSKFSVGVSIDGSVKFGGRMLGMHKKEDGTGNPDITFDIEGMDEEPQLVDNVDAPTPIDSGKGASKKQWMRPVHFRAEALDSFAAENDSAGVTVPVIAVLPGGISEQAGLNSEFTYQLDAPVWIEMAHRARRQRQRAYVVRVCAKEKENPGDQPHYSFRLKTGKDLAKVLQLGLKLRGEGDPVLPKHPTIDETGAERDELDLNAAVSGSFIDGDESETDEDKGDDDIEAHDFEDEEVEEDDDVVLVDEDSEDEYDEPAEDGRLSPASAKRRKKKTWIKKSSAANRAAAKVAKSVKTGTTITGKQVYKQGKKMGKGTVYAGKAAGRAITSVPSVPIAKPPRREPRKRTARRLTTKDHHVAVNKAVNRKLKRSSSSALSEATEITAGRLCAPDQSCRTVSHILEELSVLAQFSANSEISHLVQNQAETLSDLETYFLKGGAIELGITPSKSSDLVTAECIVARCLWESHWREEYAMLYSNSIQFYAPLTKKPIFTLALEDVQSVRFVDPAPGNHPLPGTFMLAIETAWKCTYLTLADATSRDVLANNIKTALFGLSGKATSMIKRDDDVYRAHLWQSAQSLATRGKWAPISTAKKSSKRRQRVILNSRRLGFDVDQFPVGRRTSVTTEDTEEGVEVQGLDGAEQFVQKILIKACSFSVESLAKNPQDFIAFLDDASRLRSISLSSLDLASSHTYCLVVNIYHILLQHALLLSIDGPPDKKSITQFKRINCYEIGSDVFSLAELESCIIRGRMANPVNPRPPYVEAPKLSHGYRFYALGYTDARTNFLLNRGAGPSQLVPILHPDIFDQQFNEATSRYLSHEVKVDLAKRIITLPQVCSVYRKDFGEDPYDSVSFCLQYLDEETKEKIITLFTDEVNAPSLKYQSSSDKYYTNLLLSL